MHHYPFHPGDHKLDAGHLSLEEDATYRRALDFYYVSEAPLPDDKPMLCKRLGVKMKTLTAVLEEFFILGEDGWHHTRCDAEIAKYQARAAHARETGSRGGRPRSNPTERVGLSDEKGRVSEKKANQEPEQEPTTKGSPIIPQGGGEEDDAALKNPTLPTLPDDPPQDPPSPPRWVPSPEQQQVAAWFRRRADTPWSRKELRAWKAIAFEPDDMRILNWLYTRSDYKFLRKDLKTLLYNWRGEVERARKFDQEQRR